MTTNPNLELRTNKTLEEQIFYFFLTTAIIVVTVFLDLIMVLTGQRRRFTMSFLGKMFRRQTIAEHLAEEERKQEEQEKRLSEAALRQEGQTPAASGLKLGPVIGGQSLPRHLGLKRAGNWLVMDEDPLDQHFFILGTTGAGKSEAIKRLVHEILTITDRDLFLVDGKGEPDLANFVRDMAHNAGRGDAPIFRLGLSQPGAIYNGMRGAGETLYNRFVQLVGASEATGNGAFYADKNRNLLSLICLAPEGPPRSFDDLRARLQMNWLTTTYKHDPLELALIKEIGNEGVMELTLRILPLIRELGKVVGPNGFAIEETRCSVFSIRTQSVGDTSKRFLQFLIEDIKDFVGNRQRRPGVLIIDEFGNFENENIVKLLRMARSSRLAVILATQDTASLGDESAQRMILANCNTYLLMKTNFPEEVAKLAGTIKQIESSFQHQSGEPTGMGSARVQDAFSIDMNAVARLRPGECFLIRDRYNVKIRISRVENIPSAPKEVTTPPPTLPTQSVVAASDEDIPLHEL
jgi:hypothetical protein